MNAQVLNETTPEPQAIARVPSLVGNPLVGKLVRLTVYDLEHDAEVMARWNQDSEYQQLLSSGPSNLWPPKLMKEFFEKFMNDSFGFTIRTVAEDQLIGNVDLNGVDWVARNCWVGIGIGERAYWGKGYGTEAMCLALRFAFGALNLNRVTLDVFEYNQRAYRSYLKAGFKEEGRMRQWMQRGGERYDLIFMGIMRDEWLARENQAQGSALAP